MRGGRNDFPSLLRRMPLLWKSQRERYCEQSVQPKRLDRPVYAVRWTQVKISSVCWFLGGVAIVQGS